jgi:hypothetical protein
MMSMKSTFSRVFCASVALVFVMSGTFVCAVESAKPKFGPQATRLHDSHEFIQKSVAPDYWALAPYYVPQQDSSACILSSFTMTLNAMRAANKLGADDKLVLQPALFKFMTAKDGPAKRMYVDHGKTITLDEMVDLFKNAAMEFLHHPVQVEAIHAFVQDKATTAKIEKILIENEKGAKTFVVANFLQSEFTGDPEGAIGHAAPVAAYDAKLKRVLIFDPDREYYEPYWVSLDTFVKGLATLDKDAGMNRGILWIHE